MSNFLNAGIPAFACSVPVVGLWAALFAGVYRTPDVFLWHGDNLLDLFDWSLRRIGSTLFVLVFFLFLAGPYWLARIHFAEKMWDEDKAREQLPWNGFYSPRRPSAVAQPRRQELPG